MSTSSLAGIQHNDQRSRDDKSTLLIGTNVASLAAASIAVALRFVSRRINRAPLQSDDLMIAVALVRTLRRLPRPVTDLLITTVLHHDIRSRATVW